MKKCMNSISYQDIRFPQGIFRASSNKGTFYIHHQERATRLLVTKSIFKGSKCGISAHLLTCCGSFLIRWLVFPNPHTDSCATVQQTLSSIPYIVNKRKHHATPTRPLVWGLLKWHWPAMCFTYVFLWPFFYGPEYLSIIIVFLVTLFYGANV